VVSSGIFGSGIIPEIHNIRVLFWILMPPSLTVLLFLWTNRSTGRESMPLWLAAEEGREAVVKKLLKEGENPNSFDGNGQTALCSAVMGGHEAIVKMLLEKGAKTEVTDLRGRTPLRMASGLGHEGIAMLLLKHGADPYSTKEYKRHLVMVANIVRAKRAAERLYDHEGKFTR
jgi:ankyrin repeat protein